MARDGSHVRRAARSPRRPGGASPLERYLVPTTEPPTFSGRIGGVPAKFCVAAAGGAKIARNLIVWPLSLPEIGVVCPANWSGSGSGTAWQLSPADSIPGPKGGPRPLAAVMPTSVKRPSGGGPIGAPSTILPPAAHQPVVAVRGPATGPPLMAKHT